MPRSPLALAALATVAIPGLDAYDVRRAAHQGADVDAAVVLDADGRRWVVRAPQNARAGAALEAEVALLGALVEHVDAGRLPFEVPRPAGFAHLPEGGRAVVHLQLPGRPLQLDRLGPGPGLAAALGRAIAALHELPHSTVEDAGLPVYDAEAYRRRRLSEVDEAARTGKVPAALLRRWEQALEDVALWRFQPTVVHGDLSADHVLCSRTEPVALLGWSDAKVADPADDLAWLLVAAPHEAIDPILEAYSLRRTELSDHHLASRALLAGELALARWLLHGVRVDDAEIVEDATAMLVELEQHTAAADPAPVAVPWAPAPLRGTDTDEADEADEARDAAHDAEEALVSEIEAAESEVVAVEGGAEPVAEDEEARAEGRATDVTADGDGLPHDTDSTDTPEPQAGDAMNGARPA